MQRWLASRVYYGWVMVGAAISINVVSSTVNPLVFSFLIGPMSEGLGVQRSELAWAFTLRLAAAGLMGPLLGVLIDRHGTRWLGVGSGLIVGSMLMLLSTADDLWVVYVIFAISGMAGLGGPAGQLLTQVPLAKWFVAHRGRALAIATMGMPGGTMVAVPITQWLVDTVGWRTTNLIFGVIVMVVVVSVSALLVRRVPEDMGLHPDGAAAPLAQQPESASSLTTTYDWTVGEAMRTPAMWLILLALAVSGVALTGTLVYRVDFWGTVGMSPGLVAFGTMLDPMSVVIAVYICGVFADRVHARYLGAVGFVGIGLSTVPMVVTQGEAYTIVLHNVMWGAAAAGFITLNNVVWPNYYGRKHLGAIRGIVLPVSIVASGLGPPLFGLILDGGFNPRHLWAIVTGLFILSAALVFFARPPRRPVAVTVEPDGALEGATG